MSTTQSTKELLATARSREQAGVFAAAAELYQHILQKDPAHPEAIKRLLQVFRRLKEYKQELATIDAALKVMQEKDRTVQGKWLTANPQAAKAGKAILRSLGGTEVTGYGTDNFVRQLMKRKEVVERKISGKKAARVKKITGTEKKSAILRGARKNPTRPKAALLRKMTSGHTGANVGKTVRLEATARLREKKKQEALKRKAEAIQEKQAVREAKVKLRQEAASAKKEEMRIRKEAAAKARKEDRERKIDQKERLRKEMLKRTRENAAALSLFVISLQYLVSLEEIDDEMAKHAEFLEKNFSRRIFLVSGRQVPRTGGIIIARGPHRGDIEKIMRQDPFIKRKFASFSIIEFKPSKSIKALKAEAFS